MKLYFAIRFSLYIFASKIRSRRLYFIYILSLSLWKLGLDKLILGLLLSLKWVILETSVILERMTLTSVDRILNRTLVLIIHIKLIKSKFIRRSRLRISVWLILLKILVSGIILLTHLVIIVHLRHHLLLPKLVDWLLLLVPLLPLLILLSILIPWVILILIVVLLVHLLINYN